MNEIVLAITGASGSPYAKALIDRVCSYNNSLSADSGSSNYHINNIKLFIILSDTAKQVWNEECGDLNLYISQMSGYVEVIDNKDFNFKHASGSNNLKAMIILPASMGTIGRIASGVSSDLIGRIADVQIKEKRPLFVCPRETPVSKIHLRNMLALADAGATIFPCSPSFYNRPSTLKELLDGFSARLLEASGVIPMDEILRW